MIRYVHEKFGFVHTAPIEQTWANLKRTALGVSGAMKTKTIESYLNAYTFRCIFRKEGMHTMIL